MDFKVPPSWVLTESSPEAMLWVICLQMDAEAIHGAYDKATPRGNMKRPQSLTLLATASSF